MNVLSHGQVPNVLSLREVLREWLEHRKIVLVRRSKFRLGKIAERLEVLGGFLIAYLNLDEVIRIIRTEDEPKPVMMKRFKLSDVQVEAILNMRLRALRKLEEIEIRKEFDSLKAEKKDLEALLKSDERQWKCVAYEIAEVRKTFGPDTKLGKRRTGFADAPEIDVEEMQEAMIEREPVTVVLSEKGWIRAMRGHMADLGTLTFKEGDRLKRAFHANTMDKVHAALDRRKSVHARSGKASRRARTWRAGPADARHGWRPGRGRDLSLRRKREARRRVVRRLRLSRRGERPCRQHAQGQAGAERLRPRTRRGSACRRRAIRSRSSAPTEK